MPDFGRGADRERRDFGQQGPGEGESLDAIARSDQMLDALAGQFRVSPADRGEAEMLALLEGWRDGVRRPPSNGLITEREAAEAIHRGLVQQQPAHNGTRRHLALVGSMAAAVLCLGGFGGIVAGAGPGDSLYGMRTALFGEPQSVRDDRVTLAAQTEMAEVQRLIEVGDWDQAQEKLETITTAVADVEDTSRQQELQDQWNQLNVKVENRDPAATVPPTVPPGPETLPPSLTVPLPGSETSPSETSPSETTPGETTPSETPTETQPSETQPTETQLSETQPSETQPSSGVGAPPPSATTSPVPQATTTATTPPTTTLSTSAPTTATTATTTTTTPPPPPAAVEEEAQQVPEVSTTTSALVRSAPSSAVTTTVVEAETETAPAQESPETSNRSAVTPTTTTVVPVPVVEQPVPGVN